MDYLKYIEQEIHTVVVATVDENRLPVTCAIDIMDSDDKGLYFLTAKGKNFYKRLKQSNYMALTGLKGENTMNCLAVSLSGKVQELGTEKLEKLFEKNPYVYDIYPSEESRQALTVFRLYEGSGEWFDLSKKPIERASFVIGNRLTNPMNAYTITDKCAGCQKCKLACPQNCIVFTKDKAVIQQEHCLHCGNCMEICPHNAVDTRG